MPLDEWPLHRDLVGTDVRRRNNSGHNVSDDECQHHQQRDPPFSECERNCRQNGAYDQHPLQRKSDVLIDVIDAHHEAAVLVEQHAVAAQKEFHRQGNQKYGAHSAQELRFESAGEAQVFQTEFLDVAPIRHARPHLPDAPREPVNQRPDDDNAQQQTQQVGIERNLEQIKR